MKKSSQSKLPKDEIIPIEKLENFRAERNKKIMEQVIAGVSYVTIAKDFNLTSAAISYIARQNGFVKRPELLAR